MKTTILAVIYAVIIQIVIGLVVFLLSAFIHDNFDISTWTKNMRLGLTFTIGICDLIAVIISKKFKMI